ncbi:ABC transporter ATP-binding protein [Streptomyces sp. NBC_01198]|uniref:ABC transporter ATP-binding protein n=1 Tax=Streptomyces sp. NBC_01198 TaxID=2903769 RepID=UPI002E0F9E8A|nr:ABC transporter ATP-binding protein/permease [Streptomyces sp. NBC_01198]
MAVVADTTRQDAGRVLGVTGLGLASAALALALPFALGHALDQLLRGADAARWVALCALVVAAQTATAAGEDLLAGLTTARATARIRRRTVGHMLAAGPRAAGKGAGDLVTRTVGNAADAAATPAAAAALPAALAAPVGGIVALGLTDLWLAVAFLAGAPLLTLLVQRFARASSDCIIEYQNVQGRIATLLMEALGGARTIAAAGTEEQENTRVLRPLPELGTQGRRMWQVQGRATAQAAVLVPLLQITVLAVGGVRLTAGALSLGDLLAASRYVLLATGIGVVVGQLGAVVKGRAAATRVDEVLAVPVPAHGGRQLPRHGPGTLELRAVTAVRGAETVLSRLDLTVPGGCCVAVVGRSGAGKSVLAALAGRLADPDRGTVLLDGCPLPELSETELRDAVGYAFERPVLLGDTIGDAIAFGPRPLPPDLVTAGARAAEADGFVRLLPDGYATPRNRAPFSGGEVQRLGLARAFAHPGRLLVLDDATSSLDTVTEVRVARALFHDHAHRTRLLTTHRAATAARADLVAWLDAGRIRALAPHGDLWADSEYRALFGDGADD